MSNLRGLETKGVKVEHTHLHIVFTNQQALFFPVEQDEANAGVRAFANGSPVFPITAKDGARFHFVSSSILYLRQVTAEQAEVILRDSNAAVDAQRREAQKQEEHNDALRELQLKGLRQQLAQQGVIVGA
jgi:hypothetical protein